MFDWLIYFKHCTGCLLYHRNNLALLVYSLRTKKNNCLKNVWTFPQTNYQNGEKKSKSLVKENYELQNLVNGAKEMKLRNQHKGTKLPGKTLKYKFLM